MENQPQTPAKTKKGPNALFAALAVLILAGGGVWYWFQWQAGLYFQTDNAKVTAQLYTIAATTGGKLTRYNAVQGRYVRADEILAQTERGPYLRSPVDGVVVQAGAALNQTVAAGTALAVVAQTNDVYISANVEETDKNKIQAGQRVDAQIDAFPGKTFLAHVEEVDSITQGALRGGAQSLTTSGTYTKVTQLYPVKIRLDEAVDLTEVIGANATVKIRVK